MMIKMQGPQLKINNKLELAIKDSKNHPKKGLKDDSIKLTEPAYALHLVKKIFQAIFEDDLII